MKAEEKALEKNGKLKPDQYKLAPSFIGTKSAAQESLAEVGDEKEIKSKLKRATFKKNIRRY